VSDETTISFANLSLPQEGVAVVLAEDGPKLSSAAKDLDKESMGLLSRAANISGFKGKKESTVDLLAPAGLKFSRLVLTGAGKTADYSAEDWLNLGGTVRGMLTGKEGPTAHIVLDGASKGITPEDAVNFALGAALRGYKFKKYKSKPKKKNGAAAETADKIRDALGLSDRRQVKDELKGSMDRLLAVLSDKQREIVVLRVVVGLSAEETADLVGSTPGAVRVAQHRALTRLRKLVGSAKEF